MTPTLITHLLAAAVTAAAAWFYQGARMDAAVAAVRLKMSVAAEKAADEKLQAVGVARDEERAIAKIYQEALNAARTRETALLRDRDAARAESDGVREQAADAARRLAEAPPAAVLEYATTTNELFVDCGRRYAELAEKADGHASDVRTLTEAWPRTEGPQ